MYYYNNPYINLVINYIMCINIDYFSRTPPVHFSRLPLKFFRRHDEVREKQLIKDRDKTFDYKLHLINSQYHVCTHSSARLSSSLTPPCIFSPS